MLLTGQINEFWELTNSLVVVVVIDDFDRNSFSGSKVGKYLVGQVPVGDEKLETKTMNNSLKQVGCKEKAWDGMAVRQEAAGGLRGGPIFGSADGHMPAVWAVAADGVGDLKWPCRG